MTLNSMPMAKNEEEKNESETTDTEAEQSEETTDAGNEGEQSEVTDDTAAKDKKSDADYEAELALEKQRSADKDKIIADQAFKLRNKNRKEGKDEDEEDESEEGDEKPLTASQLKKHLDERDQRILKESQRELIRTSARKIAGSDAEAELIIEIHKNRSWPSNVPLSEQLEEAQAIANRKKSKVKIAELGRALKSKDGVQETAANTHRDSAPIPQPKLSANDISVYKSAGFEWDGKKGLFKKALGKGRFLWKDHKTGKIFKA